MVQLIPLGYRIILSFDIMIAGLIPLASLVVTAQRTPPPSRARRAWASERLSRGVDVPS